MPSVPETLALADSIVNNSRVNLAEMLSLADAGLKSLITLYADSLILGDSVSRLTQYVRLALEQMGLDDMLKASLGVTSSDTIPTTDLGAIAAAVIRGSLVDVSDSASRLMAKQFQDSLAAIDHLVASTSKHTQDLLGLADAMQQAVAFLALADDISLDDSAGVRALKLLIDVAGLVDSVASQVSLHPLLRARLGEGRFDQAVFDAAEGGDVLGVADALSVAQGLGMVVQDLLALLAEIRALVAGSSQDAEAITDSIARKIGRPLESTSLSVTDSLALLPKPATEDLITVLDAFMAKSSPQAADIVTAVDSWFFRWAGVFADIVTLADALVARLGLTQQDAMLVADAYFALIRRSVSDETTFADALYRLFGRLLTGEPTATTDASSARVLAVRESALAISDAWALLTGRSLQDMAVELADAVHRKFGRETSSPVSHDDALFLVSRAVTMDQIAIVDALSRVFGMPFADAVTIADGVATHIRIALPRVSAFGEGRFDFSRFDIGETADPIGLEDVYALVAHYFRQHSADLSIADEWAIIARKVLSVTLQVTDQYVASVGVKTLTQVGLSELLVLSQIKTLSDMLALADAAARAVLSTLTSSTSVNDWLSTKATISLWHTLVLPDALDAKMAKALSSAATLSDSVAAGVGSYVDTVATLADQLTRWARIPREDAFNIADDLVSSLTFWRQAQDAISLLDEIRRGLSVLHHTLLSFSDEAWRTMQASRQEALSLADLIGKAGGKQVASEAVGVLDEARLLAALRLASAGVLVDDAVSGEVKQLVGQVWIQGVSVPVTGLSIKQSANERVSECSFKVIMPSAEVKALARQRADVHVYLLDGGVLDMFGGRIVGNPISSEGGTVQTLDVTVHDYTAEAHDVMVNDLYTADEGSLTDWLKAKWQEVYPYPIDFSGVNHSDKTADVLPFEYESLFDVTEKIAGMLGWVWRVSWDGGTRRLLFYPPSAAISQTVFSERSGNFVTGTARFGQDDEICNAAWVLGGNAISDTTMTDRFVADGERVAYRLRRPPHGISLSVNGIPQTVGARYLHNPEDYDCLLDYDQAEIEWRSDNKPTRDAVIEAVYRYSYPVVAHVEDRESIRLYGRMEKKIIDSKIRSAVEARETGRRCLTEKAFPKGYGALEILVGGLNAGDFVTVNLPQMRATGLYEIVEIHKWVDSGIVRRSVTLNVCDNPEERIARRLHDFARRLAVLEQASVRQAETIQRFVRMPENLAITVSALAAGDIEDSLVSLADLYDITSERLLSDEHVFHRNHEAVRYEDFVLSGVSMLRSSDTALREVARVGLGVFDRARFDVEPFGQEVVAE